MSGLDEGARALLSQPIHGWVTAVRPDGSLHNTVVWVDVDGDDVVVNTAAGRVKERLLRGNPQISVSVLDPEDPFHWVSVSGSAVFEAEGADTVIDGLAKKYLGADSYPFRQAGEERLTVRIRPENVIYSAGR